MAYIESVIIRDTGGTEADVTAANALKVDGSAVTQPVNVVAGTLTANLSLQVDAFQQTIFANRYNQVEVKFDQTDPDLISDLTVTKTTTGDASNATGQALFTTGANTNGGVSAITNTIVTYRPHAEVYCAFTCIWTSGGLANSYQRIGIFDTNNGFFIGYEGATFGVTIRKGGVDTQTAQAAFNVDTLTGAVTSKYTRAGVPEAANFALDNLFRIRYGWLGAAPIIWEIFSPDGEWVVFNIQRHPNTVAVPTINNPDLPIHLELKKNGAGATVLDMYTACWAAGTSSDLSKVTDTITDNTLAPTVRSVIAGRSSTGGGTYYNVKVNPSGALVTTNDSAYAEDSAAASGNIGTYVLGVRNDTNAVVTSTDGDYSQISVNDKGAIAIQDGGNSITVDGSVSATVSGTVAATQSGAWSVGVNNAAGASAVNIQDGGNSITVDNTGTFAVQITSGGPTQYAEDTAHASGDLGFQFLGVRNDNASNTFAGSNGDYSPVSTDQYGKLFTVSERVHNTPHTVSDIGSFVLAVRNDNAVNSAATANNTYASISVDEYGKVYGAENKQEDTAHTSGQTGSFVLGVRNDSNAAMTSTDGDYSPIAVNANGAVAINDGGNSITVDGSVTSTISGTVSVSVDADTVGLATEATLLNVDTNTKEIARATKLEDDPSVDGDRGMFVLAVRNDANAVVTDTDGDYSQISVNSKGAVAINDGGNSITVDGTVSVSGTVTVSGTVAATQSGTWILGANSGVDIGDVTVNNAGGASAVNIQDGGNSITVDGTVAATQSGTWILGANSGVDIGDVTINNAGGASAVNIQDGGNSITVDGTVAATQSGTWNVVAAGDVAHDTADSGNPVKIGFQAETSLPTAVASNDRSNGVSDRYGRQLVGHIDPGMQTWESFNATSTQTGATIWQPTAGNRIAITYIGVSSYGTTAARVILWFGAAADTTYTAGTDQLVWAGSFAPSANSKPGAIITLPHPIFAATTDHYLKITTDAGISIDVTVYGYEFTP